MGIDVLGVLSENDVRHNTPVYRAAMACVKEKLGPKAEGYSRLVSERAAIYEYIEARVLPRFTKVAQRNFIQRWLDQRKYDHLVLVLREHETDTFYSQCSRSYWEFLFGIDSYNTNVINLLAEGLYPYYLLSKATNG